MAGHNLFKTLGQSPYGNSNKFTKSPVEGTTLIDFDQRETAAIIEYDI